MRKKKINGIMMVVYCTIGKQRGGHVSLARFWISN